MLRKKWWGVIALCCLIGLALLGYYFWSKAKAKELENNRPTVVVTRGDIEETIRGTGTMQPLKRVEVGAQVSGQLKKVEVILGQVVQQGELLATIDPTLAMNDVKSQQVELDQALAEKEGKVIELTQALHEQKRQHALWAEQANAKTEVEQADLRVKSLKNDIKLAEIRARRAKLNLDSSRAKLDYTRIVAPISGMVVNVAVQEGQTIVSSQQAPIIMTLANLDTMTVRAQVPEADINRIFLGQEVFFMTLGDAEKRYTGRVRAIQPVPEKVNSTVYYIVLFDVANSNQMLRADMSVQISFLVGRAKNVLMLPTNALGDPITTPLTPSTLTTDTPQNIQLGNQVASSVTSNPPDATHIVQAIPAQMSNTKRYQVEVKTAKEGIQTREITTGITDGVNIAVLSGLREGETVVLSDTAPMEADAQDEAQ